MPILPIKIYGSDVLRQQASPVEKMTDDLRRMIGEMRDSLYYHQGAGLAANQIGVPRQIFLADDGRGLLVCINPRIVELEGKAVAEEGCLSLPEIYIDIERADSLKLEYLDQDWELKQIDAEGLLCRIIQHEVDHLKGVLISDRAGFVTRKLIAGKLRKLEKRVQESF